MALKVLDAPKLFDDFYINVLDWSENNMLCVALHNTIYVWNGFTQEVKKCVDLREYSRKENKITSI